jgi:hypothetical protein
MGGVRETDIDGNLSTLNPRSMFCSNSDNVLITQNENSPSATR